LRDSRVIRFHKYSLPPDLVNLGALLGNCLMRCQWRVRSAVAFRLRVR
jgi:hypothetical protein